ncbi:MAG: hypothetical protein KJO39_03900 [Bacteroidia bacterium]|nr:hypothetical protein [Bacteroidia bacterium]
MMKKNLLLLGFFVSICGAAQNDLPDMSAIDTLIVKSYWGEVNVNGVTGNKSGLKVVHTDSQAKRKMIDNSASGQYYDMKVNGKTLRLAARSPKGFESLDFILSIPNRIFVQVEMIKGGEIVLQNLLHGIEVNHRNGSFKGRNIGDYALVNLANGSIDIKFNSVNRSRPISLVTMNGGITVSLPKTVRRDVRLISRKNGYLWSDFDLTGVLPVARLNVRSYSKEPIDGTVKINGGGKLLFLSTENGPIEILKD